MYPRLRQVVVLVAVGLALCLPVTALAVKPEPGPFDQTWARTDLPVEHGTVKRTWMWGPEALSFTQYEPYAGSPDDQRLVQYFDKARMEITDPEEDPNALWYVTNGLLVTELVTGRMQVGDDEFVRREPAEINVAGDPDDPNGPTYATFARVLDAEPLPVTEGHDLTTISWRIDRAGNVTESPELATYGVTTRYFDDVTDHSIARPFWEFMTSAGAVFEKGQFYEDNLFENPFYATGRPITEAYWSSVLVGGETVDVLIQCFERRCLTYTPDNPEGWKVEAGNVGRHYYEWRYGGKNSRIAYSYQGDIWVMHGDGSDPVRITRGDAFDSQPLWSPDSSRLLYLRTVASGSSSSTSYELHVTDADGSNDLLLANIGSYGTSSGIMPSFDWSPDGQRVAFNAASSEATINIINADGTGQVTLTGDLGGPSSDLDWSPVDDRIVFKHVNTPGDDDDPKTGLYVIEADGENLAQLTSAGFEDNSPRWSPDASRIAFVQGQTFETRDLYVMDYDGTDVHVFAAVDGAGSPSWSPDGEYLAFIAQSQLWVAGADGSNLDLLTPHIFTAQRVGWSAVAPYQIIFTAAGELGGLATVSVDGEDLHIQFADGGREPAWGS